MREIVCAGRFKQDLKRMKKQGVDLELLRAVLDKLLADKTLERKYSDHAFQGKLSGKRDCHITRDCVLIYAISLNQLILYRTGTHSDLFK